MLKVDIASVAGEIRKGLASLSCDVVVTSKLEGDVKCPRGVIYVSGTVCPSIASEAHAIVSAIQTHYKLNCVGIPKGNVSPNMDYKLIALSVA